MTDENMQHLRQREVIEERAEAVAHNRASKKKNREAPPPPLTGLREEGVEGIVTTSNGFVRGHLPVGLDAVFKAVKLPTSVT